MLPKINEFTPEGWKMETPENRAAFQSASSLADACRDRQILEGRAVICDSSHNLVVDCGCMRGLIPREEGAIGMNDGSVRDIAVISRVNRPVCFLVTGFQKNEDGKTIALLSRRAAQEPVSYTHLDVYKRQLLPLKPKPKIFSNKAASSL